VPDLAAPDLSTAPAAAGPDRRVLDAPAAVPPLSRRARRRDLRRPDGEGPIVGDRAGSPSGDEAPEGAGPDGTAVSVQPRRGGRAGRNLPMAIAVGVVLVAAILASLLFRKEAFVVLVSASVLVGLWELTGAFALKSINVPVIPLAVGSLGMLVSAFVAGEDGLLVSFALTAFGVLLWRIIDGTEGAARDVTAGVFTAAYLPFMAGFTMLMLAASDGAQRVLTFFLVGVASDVGGYAFGVMFGKHPMAPTVSPKKSWEGFGGSVLGCVVAGAVGVPLMLHGAWWAGAVVGVVAAVTSTVGDLSESLIKRDLGVKDMGNLLPGHGGIMDRLDSLLVTAPGVYVLLSLLVPIA
jgi:phosphatidate cytidylyltransferase